MQATRKRSRGDAPVDEGDGRLVAEWGRAARRPAHRHHRHCRCHAPPQQIRRCVSRARARGQSVAETRAPHERGSAPMRAAQLDPHRASQLDPHHASPATLAAACRRGGAGGSRLAKPQLAIREQRTLIGHFKGQPDTSPHQDGEFVWLSAQRIACTTTGTGTRLAAMALDGSAAFSFHASPWRCLTSPTHPRRAVPPPCQPYAVARPPRARLRPPAPPRAPLHRSQDGRAGLRDGKRRGGRRPAAAVL